MKTYAQLSSSSKIMYNFFGKFKSCCYSISTMAEYTGLCPKTVIKSIHDLENENIIKVVRNKGFMNTYYLLIDLYAKMPLLSK